MLKTTANCKTAMTDKKTTDSTETQLNQRMMTCSLTSNSTTVFTLNNVSMWWYPVQTKGSHGAVARNLLNAAPKTLFPLQASSLGFVGVPFQLDLQ